MWRDRSFWLNTKIAVGLQIYLMMSLRLLKTWSKTRHRIMSHTNLWNIELLGSLWIICINLPCKLYPSQHFTHIILIQWHYFVDWMSVIKEFSCSVDNIIKRISWRLLWYFCYYYFLYDWNLQKYVCFKLLEISLNNTLMRNVLIYRSQFS